MSKSNTKLRPGAESTSSLSECALLTDLTISLWHGKKTDKRATQELHTIHNASSKAGDYRKRLLGDCGPLKDIHDIAGDANRRHRELTLAWADDGRRILASAGFDNYQHVMGEFKTAFYRAVPKFLSEYPQLCNAARHELGTLFLVEEYPTVAELKGKFRFDWSFTQVPDVNDFRVRIRDDERRLIIASAQEDTQSHLNTALSDVYGRVETVVGHMVDRLKMYKMTDKGLVGKFHDTLISNIEDVANMLPGLNVTGDVRFDRLAERLKNELAVYNAQDLRNSKALRAEAVKKAQGILDSIKAVAA